MNNPFGASTATSGPSSAAAANHINNPFDADPSSARNRFPDLSAPSPASSSPFYPSQSPLAAWQHHQQHQQQHQQYQQYQQAPQQQPPWSSMPLQQQNYGYPSQFAPTATTQPPPPPPPSRHQQQQRAFSPYGDLPSPTAGNFFSSFPPASGGSIHTARFTSMGVASGGPYTAVPPTLETSYDAIGSSYHPNGLSAAHHHANAGVGLGLGPASATSPPPPLPHPLLSQFDPLSTASSSNTPSTPFSSSGSIHSGVAYSHGGGGPGSSSGSGFYAQQPQQQAYLGQQHGAYTNANGTPIGSSVAAAAGGMDPGGLHRAPGPHPYTMTLTGFGGAVTVLVRVRGHTYGPHDHPCQVVQLHRAEMEQWDAYGWRQTLNALESLRFTWDNWRDDLGRGMGEVPPGSREEALLKAAQRDAIEKIDTVTAAYLQMQEVYVSYRQSSDPASKKRVRECLNAGLRNLPEWP